MFEQAADFAGFALAQTHHIPLISTTATAVGLFAVVERNIDRAIVDPVDMHALGNIL